MTAPGLQETARALVSGGKGLLAMDESNHTCDARLAAAGIPPGPEMRRAWRDLLVTTPGLGDCVNGAILYDETIRQHTVGGHSFVEALGAAGIIAGIKVDGGAKPLAGHPGETVTEGLDGLRERLRNYVQLGARFAKWRAVIALDDARPSRGCIAANAEALARYAALCQEAGLVPIVEPEVLMAGAHTMARCQQVTGEVLGAVFAALGTQHVLLEGMILKPNMVLPGADCPEQVSVAAVAEATVTCLLRSVPAALPGIAFLSGGQSGERAAANLNAMQSRSAPAGRLPWTLAFSFARAIQFPALTIWRGDQAQRPAAQQALLHRAHCSAAAMQGTYDGVLDVA